MSNKIGFARGQAYLGTNADQPPNWAQFTDRPPTQYDNQNVSVGDLWLDTSPIPPLNPNVWVLVGLEGNSTSKGVLAHWIRFGGGNGDIVSLTGNTTLGGPPLPVFPDVNGNINTIGDNIGIAVDGDPATNTLTWSLVGGGLATQSYHTDDNNVEVPIGTAVIPVVGANGQINIVGGATGTNVYTNINTKQGADIHTVAVDLNNSIGQPNTIANGSQGVYALGGNNNFILDRFMHNYGTANTFLGHLSGNMALTVANATDNTCLGSATGPNLLGTAGGQGQLNTFIGSSAGFSATNASGNFFGGALSGTLATTATLNTAVGLQSLTNLLTGSNNVAVGYLAASNYTGAESNNICIGIGATGKAGEIGAIRINSTVVAGDNPLFIGNGSGNNTYTAGVALFNTAVGTSTLTAVTTGAQNTVMGNAAGGAITSGNNNTLIGYVAGAGVTTGASNSALGDAALAALTTGSNNLVLGAGSGGNYTGAESWNIILGNPTAGVLGESSVCRIGSTTNATPGAGRLAQTFICGIRGITTGVNDAVAVLVDSANQLGTVSSTRTVKDNINKMGSYSDDLYKLRPVTFNYKQHTPDAISVGLIAEEVEEVMPRLVAYQDGKPMSVKYHDLPAMLLNELQKLEKRVKELEECQKQV